MDQILWMFGVGVAGSTAGMWHGWEKDKAYQKGHQVPPYDPNFPEYNTGTDLKPKKSMYDYYRYKIPVSSEAQPMYAANERYFFPGVQTWNRTGGSRPYG